MKSFRLFVIIMAASWLIGPGISMAENKPIEAFYGAYSGESEEAEGGEMKRDLSVNIHPGKKNGFIIEWATTRHKKNGKAKLKKYKISFHATDRDNIFAAAMQTNLFGKKIPLDPLKGEPYVWSRIIENTLTTFVMMINTDGGYELQRYDRTLSEAGLDVHFSRIREGKQLKNITAKLKKQ